MILLLTLSDSSRKTEGWSRWNEALRGAVLKTQSNSGDERGSWDPVGPWGYAGGRIYATAMMALCLESYYRYPRVSEL